LLQLFAVIYIKRSILKNSCVCGPAIGELGVGEPAVGESTLTLNILGPGTRFDP
jgi:hypothetical protein